MKCATLVRRSTTTHMESYPHLVLGNPVMKSIPILSHFQSGIGSGCNNPAGFWFSAFTLLHTSHKAICSAMSFLRLFHPNLSFMSMYILVLPGLIEYGELCASCKISFRSSESCGTQIRFPCHKVPCSSSWNPLALPLPIFSLISSISLSVFWASLILSNKVG